ncbi:MAG: dipeptide epimerase [Pseudomarimonas sp.]
MKITKVRLGVLRVPLKTPFITALRSVHAVEDIVVMIHTDDGRVGYGAAAATAIITGDTHGSIIAAIRAHIAPRVLGEDIADLNHLTHVVQTALTRNSSAKAAVEIALYDLWAQRHGAPLYRMLGGGKPTLCTDITISVDSVERMLADCESALARGFDALKIKVGKDIALDLQRITAIHAAVAGRARLRLDANQGWTPKQAVWILNRLESSGVELELVEQPVPASDLAGLQYVTERVNTPVMADESAFDALQVIEIIQRRAADIINIKLMKCGGLSNAIRIADIAQLHGIECMMGCMLEGSIGVAAAAHLAVAKAQVITLIDLDGPSLCLLDPVRSGVDFNDAQIAIGDAPGLGVTAIDGLELLPD